jgi:hypothetical protein
VLDQAALNHCDQIAMVIAYDESNWTPTPCALALEIGKPLSMLFVR